MGKPKSPLERYRKRAASETIWSNAGWMKSANWISATGSRPCSAIPMATPTIPDSASGVSSTRSSPNSSRKPAVTRNTPPRAPTSSPSTRTRSSSRISSHSVSWIVWTRFFSVIVRSGGPLADRGRSCAPRGELPPRTPLRVQVQERRLRLRVGRAPCPVDRLVDLRLQLGAGLLDAFVVDQPERLQVGAEAEDGIVALGLL